MQSRMQVFALCVTLLALFGAAGQTEPLTLGKAVSEALLHNPRLIGHAEQISAVKAGRWDEILPENPELFTEYEGIPYGSPISDYGEKKLGISQVIELPWMYYYRGKSNTLESRAGQAGYQSLKQDITVEVKKAFYRVLLLQNQMTLYEDIVRLTENLYRTAKIKVDAGETTAYESLRAKVDLAEAENRHLEVSTNHTYALYALKQLLGRGKDDTLEITGEMTFEPVDIDIDRLKETSLHSHPSLKQALYRVEQRSVEKKLSKLSFVPAVSVSYFAIDMQEDSSTGWGGEIGLSIPIWGIWKERGRLKAAGHNLQAAGWHVEAEKRRVLADVERAANSLIVAQDHLVKYRDDVLGEVDEMVRIAEKSYAEGEMSYLEITEALRTMQRAKAGYYEALYDFLAAEADLEQAVGTPIRRLAK